MPLLAPHSPPDPSSDRLHFSRREAAGALGDLGTFVPLLVGMVTLCGLQLAPALLFAGLMNVITGLRFRIPMTIQPMKAIAAVAIAERLSEADILAGGIITGVVILAFGLFQFLDKLAALVPQSVVRGLQLAMGVKLGLGGFWMVVGDGPVYDHNSIMLGLLCLAVALLLGKSSRFPTALVIFAIGLVWLATAGLPEDTLALAWPRWHLPQLWDRSVWLTGFWQCAVPQVPLTLLNSVVAVCALSADLFPARPASPRSVATSVGLINLLCCPWGAMPMCHGAGGLASQYRFGARSGGSLVILGAGMVALALLFGGSLLVWLEHYPRAVLGVLLGLGGLELARVCRDQLKWRDSACMLVTCAACLLTNMALGFLAGCTMRGLCAGLLKASYFTNEAPTTGGKGASWVVLPGAEGGEAGLAGALSPPPHSWAPQREQQ